LALVSLAMCNGGKRNFFQNHNKIYFQNENLNKKVFKNKKDADVVASTAHNEVGHSDSHPQVKSSGVVVANSGVNSTAVNSTQDTSANVKSEVHNNVVSVTKGGSVKANAGFRLSTNAVMTIVPLAIAFYF